MELEGKRRPPTALIFFGKSCEKKEGYALEILEILHHPKTSGNWFMYVLLTLDNHCIVLLIAP